MNNTLYLGIKGRVVAFDKATGQRLWERPLKGSNFVNVFYDKGDIFALAQGELFCVDAATGALKWQDGLSGLGYGLGTFASATGSQLDQVVSVIAEKLRQDEAARQSAASSSGAGS